MLLGAKSCLELGETKNFSTFADDASSTGPTDTEGTQMNTYAGAEGIVNRLGSQTSKWKRQVQEQRRNIYDRHAMLN